MSDRRDHVDRFLEQLKPLEGVDYEVEGIVERVSAINRRIKRGMEATLAEFDLAYQDFHVLGTLRNSGPRTPGKLAKSEELSTGAMTSRLDKLEGEGLIRRVPAPDDRRSVVVELTDAGREKYEQAVSVQGRKEAFFASALTKAEQQRLNTLLRKLLLALEDAEAAR